MYPSGVRHYRGDSESPYKSRSIRVGSYITEGILDHHISLDVFEWGHTLPRGSIRVGSYISEGILDHQMSLDASEWVHTLPRRF